MSSKMTGEDIGINTLDPKVRLHINNGAVFVDSGGLNPNSTPLNSYYNTGNETSPQIILGNEDAWDSTDQNSPQSYIKCRLLNYNGQGFRVTVNDGTVVYDHTSNQWQSRTYDYDLYPSQYLFLNELTNTNQGSGTLLTCGLNVSGNYTGSLSDGDRLCLYADGSLKITGHLKISDSDYSGGTNYSQGSIRYNISTNDFEGFTSEWKSLTQSGGLSNTTTTLFLDYDIAKNDVGGSTNQSYLFGKASSNPDYVVSEFADFKTNHSDKYKLISYSQEGQFEVLISDLIAINPTSNNHLGLFKDDNAFTDNQHSVYFDGDDLYYIVDYNGDTTRSNTRFPPYRIDVHSYAEAPSNMYTKSEVNALISSVATGSDESAILWFHYPTNHYGNPQNETVIIDALNSTYPPANYSPLKRLILHTNDAEGSGGDTQFRSRGYLFIRNQSLPQWDFIGYIDDNFDWSLIEPPTLPEPPAAGSNFVHVESETINVADGTTPLYTVGAWNVLTFDDLFPTLTENAVFLVTCYALWIPVNAGHSVYFRNPHPNGISDNSTPYTNVIDPNDSAFLIRAPNGGGSMMFTMVAERSSGSSVAIKYWPTQGGGSHLTFTSSHCMKIG